MKKRHELSQTEIDAFRAQLADPANKIILSDEAFDKVSEMIEKPDPEATQKLKELLNRPSRFDVV